MMLSMIKVKKVVLILKNSYKIKTLLHKKVIDLKSQKHFKENFSKPCLILITKTSLLKRIQMDHVHLSNKLSKELVDHTRIYLALISRSLIIFQMIFKNQDPSQTLQFLNLLETCLLKNQATPKTIKRS